MTEPDKTISRRSFIGTGIASVVGAGLGVAGAANGLGASTPPRVAQDTGETEKKPMIKEYRTLGRTGYKVSDISFGNGRMTDPALLEYAIERGMNYVDTARQYFDANDPIVRVEVSAAAPFAMRVELETWRDERRRLTGDELQRYLRASAPVGVRLADQLMVPFAIAGGGAFRTLPLSEHARTNLWVIEQFMPGRTRRTETEDEVVIEFGDGT